MARQIVEKVLKYNAVFDPCDEGGFTVTVPKMPGLVTEGDTYEEAVAMVTDAIELYLLNLKEDGLDFPETDEVSFIAPISIDLPKLKLAI